MQNNFYMYSLDLQCIKRVNYALSHVPMFQSLRCVTNGRSFAQSGLKHRNDSASALAAGVRCGGFGRGSGSGSAAGKPALGVECGHGSRPGGGDGLQAACGAIACMTE